MTHFTFDDPAYTLITKANVGLALSNPAAFSEVARLEIFEMDDRFVPGGNTKTFEVVGTKLLFDRKLIMQHNNTVGGIDAVQRFLAEAVGRSKARTMTDTQFSAIPKLEQTQAALNDQLLDLIAVANRLGLYDAADHLKRSNKL